MKKLRLSFNQSRECTYRIYDKRGYASSTEFVEILNKLGLITLEDRIKLKQLLFVLSSDQSHKNREKRLKNKIIKKCGNLISNS